LNSRKKNYKRYYFGDHDVALELNNEFKDKTSIVILSKIINEDFAYVNFINSMLSLGLKSPLYQEVREKRISLLYSLLSIKNE
jgi:predicted Zn-dependent peptidase